MTLEDAVTQLEQFDEELMICARQPWTRSSEVVLVPSPEGRIPQAVTDAGYAYFLEVAVAREVLEVFKRTRSIGEKIDCLLYYAENDAWPDWVYE
jgi:hypothetical protein